MRPSPEKPRVFHLIASLNLGGTERQLVELINRSSCPERHTVAVFDEPGPLAERLGRPPVFMGPIARQPRHFLSNLRTITNLRRLVRASNPDVVHAHLGISEVLAAIAVPPGIPIVAARRGHNIGFDSGSLKIVEGLAHRRSRLLLCNSEHLAAYARRHDLWCPPTSVIYNAVDPDTYRPVELPSLNHPTIAVVARFKWYKRQSRFLAAMSLAARAVPSLEALLVGDGEDKALLEREVRAHGLERNVHFVGRVPDVRAYVAAAHAVCLTSDHEGFPNALLEGMAMGRPAIATRVGGIPELVEDGVSGLLASTEPESIALAIEKLFCTSGLIERMSAAARARAEHFDWPRVVRETENAYETAIHHRDGRQAAEEGVCVDS